MLAFHLSSTSGVPTYLQIVEQVRQALRLGRLEPGDRLPTVREVAAALAINPNTVLKAYRELEYEQLVEGRHGLGTYVVGSLAGPSPGTLDGLRNALGDLGGPGARCGTVARAHQGGRGHHAPPVARRQGLGVSGALVADGLTKRYRRTLALDHCSFAIPEGAIVALVGPNGAGKSTLLHCATGLTRPSAGTIRVLGGEPGDRTLPGVGFVAQDAPLYRDFTADELLTMGDKLNRDFDVAFGRERLPKVGVPLDRRVDRLSGGQRAQVALCLALAKRPRLLLLDEPLASLDPLARREFLSAMVDAVAETPTTVVLSSHLVTDLERVCDHLLVLHAGRVQVFAETDQLLATHKILIGPGGPRRARIAGVDEIVHATDAQRQSTLLVRTNAQALEPAWEQRDVSLEDLVLAYLAANVETPPDRQDLSA